MKVGDLVEIYANPRHRGWEAAFKRFMRGDKRIYKIIGANKLPIEWGGRAEYRISMINKRGKPDSYFYYVDEREIKLVNIQLDLDKFM